MPYLKLKLKSGTVDITSKPKKRLTMYMDVVRESNQFYFGYEVDPKTLDAIGSKFKGKVLHETQHLIAKAAVVRVTPMYEDMKYCDLTEMTPEQQRAKYGDMYGEEAGSSDTD
jgi:hypothetical protein